MTLIAVHGAASRFLPAERGTVRLSLALEGEDRAIVLRDVALLHERFVADAKTFVHGGAATWWGSDQVRVRPERRYLKDSETYRWVQVANAEVRVKFQDFGALSDWVDRAGSVVGVSIGGIDWTLTDAHREQEEKEVRVEAVRDARLRAEAYASAIGGTGVTLQALYEPGLRPSGDLGGGGGGVMARAMGKFDASGGIELRPDDIEIEASVTADFLVEG